MARCAGVAIMAAILLAVGCRLSGTAMRIGSPPALDPAGDRTSAPLTSQHWDAVESVGSPPTAGPQLDEGRVNTESVGAANSQLASLRIPSPADTLPLPSAETISLTLDDAIAMSLERNPDLLALRAAEPVAHAAFHVAETYRFNPQFQTQVAPYSRDRDGNDAAVGQQHVLVQTFELAGQRGFRTGAAAADCRRVAATIGQAELTNVAQTERLFFTTLYQRELRDLMDLLAGLNEQMVGVVERRFQAGEANGADVALAGLQAQSARRQQRLAETRFLTSLAKLRNHLNLDADIPCELAANWLDWHWRSFEQALRPEVSTVGLSEAGNATTRGETDESMPLVEVDSGLVRQLVTARPDVIAARAAVAAAEEGLRLANAMRRPDLQIGPMWQRDESSTEFWGVQAQIDIPVVNTGMPMVRQREAELCQQQVAASQLEERVFLEARAAMQRYERARRSVEQSRGELSGSVRETLQPVEDQFLAGQISLLEVFAVRTSLAQSRQSLLELMDELAQSAADVTATTSLQPQRLFGRTPSPVSTSSRPAEAPEEIPIP